MRLYAFFLNASSYVDRGELTGSAGGELWGDVSASSLPVMSCHLLCFPFALELSPEKLVQILQCYHSANVVKGLVQVQPLCFFYINTATFFFLVTYFVL